MQISSTYLSQTIPKIEGEETFPNSFYRANITLIPKPDKDTMKKENHMSKFFMYIDAKIINTV